MTAWIALMLAVPGTLAAVLGIANRHKLGEIQVHVDGRLDEAIAVGKANVQEKANLREQVLGLGGNPDDSIPAEPPEDPPIPPEVLPYA